MRIIVTGGLGFIGSNFIRRIAKSKNYDIINIDKMTYAANPLTAKELESFSNYLHINEDICNQSAMDSIIRLGDIVVNFAAESHVDRSIQSSNVFLETNVFGTQSLLTAARNRQASLFIQVSTDEVFGSLGPTQNSSTEKDILCPSSPYSASKAAAEMLCFAAMRTFDQPILITRSSNNYGPYQYPEKVIPLFITNLMQGKSVPLYGNGSNIRDWLFVEDNCEAIEYLIRNGKVGEIYNIGGGYEISNINLTLILLEKMGKDGSYIKYVMDRVGHDFRYSLDCSKIKNLGWKPRTDFDTGISKTIEWYVKNKEWWNSI